MAQWSIWRLPMTLHGWDPLRIVAQMCALQCIHYILLAAFVPPLLSIFTEPAALRFEGGPAQVGMMLDWREVASKPTWDWNKLIDFVNMYTGWKQEAQASPFTPSEQVALGNWTAGAIWLNMTVAGASEPHVIVPTAFRWNDTSSTMTNDDVALSTSLPAVQSAPTSTFMQQEQQLEQWEYKHTHDSRRGWAISAAWMLTVFFDVQVLYYLVRKPTHVLDFVCTMHFVHFVITTSFAGTVPHSLFWWALMILHASLCIVLSERLAIQREMRMGFTDHEMIESRADSYELVPPRTY